jgi:lipooligosaccharide transport system permease protein
MTALARPQSTVWRVFEHRYLQYRRTFRASIFSSFLSPVMFLAAMGLGLGTYVDQSGTDSLGGVSYLAFLAPGLLAATSMQAAAFEATFPIMSGLVWNKVFHAMYATPISPRDIAIGNLFWIVTRLTLICSVFTLVIVLFGAAASWQIVLAIPAAVLTGMAFAGPIAAFSATQYTPNRFATIFRFGITPLFLLSGTFYPLDNLPAILQALAWLTPLYHGVALTRGLSLGTAGEEPLLMVVHVVVLLAFAIGGSLATIVTVQRRMIK